MIGIIMGSTSDLPVMQQAIDVLDELGLAYEVDIVSAHRTPEKLMDYGQNAHKRGIKAIIAGAGGAAHLPGMVASVSPLPVIGVPVHSSNSIDGLGQRTFYSSNAGRRSCSNGSIRWCKERWYPCCTDCGFFGCSGIATCGRLQRRPQSQSLKRC